MVGRFIVRGNVAAVDFNQDLIAPLKLLKALSREELNQRFAIDDGAHIERWLSREFRTASFSESFPMPLRAMLEEPIISELVATRDVGSLATIVIPSRTFFCRATSKWNQRPPAWPRDQSPRAPHPTARNLSHETNQRMSGHRAASRSVRERHQVPQSSPDPPRARPRKHVLSIHEWSPTESSRHLARQV